MLRPDVPTDPPMWVSIASLVLIALFIIITLFVWFSSDELGSRSRVARGIAMHLDCGLIRRRITIDSEPSLDLGSATPILDWPLPFGHLS